MSKIKTTLKEPDIDNRLLDDRGVTAERARRGFRDQQSPIMRAVSRGIISEQHGRAAKKFYDHWIRCKYATLPTNWKAEPSSGGISDHIPLARTELQAFSRRQIWNAIGFIHDDMDRSGMSNDAIRLLFSVVCEEVPFEQAGKMVFEGNGISVGTLALRYVRSALRILSIRWNIS